MAATLEQINRLGYQFIYDPQKRTVFVIRPKGYGKSRALERLRRETPESLRQEGVNVVTDSIYNYVSRSASLPGFGYSPGDVDTFSKVLDSAGATVQAIETALRRVDPAEVNAIAVGNTDIPFNEARRILGQDVQFSREAQAQQAREGEAQAAARDERDRARRSGRIPTRIRDTGSGYEILDSRNGNVLETQPYTTENKNVVLAQVLARQNQITTGSTPQLSGRPDLYATEPTQEEREATFGRAFEPYSEPLTGIPVAPSVATPEQISQLQTGTLENYPTALGGTYLDGSTFERLRGLGLTEADIFRVDERIYLRPGISEQTLIDRQAGITTERPSTGSTGGTGQTGGTEESGGGTTIDGVDTTGWSDAMIAQFQALQNYLNELNKSGKIVNPDVEISDDLIAQFKQQAQIELGPHYQQVFKQAQQDAERLLSRFSEDFTSQQEEIGARFGSALEGAQESFAQRGREYSSERAGVEQELAENARRQLDAAFLQQRRGAEDTGIRSEREIGSTLFGQVRQPTVDIRSFQLGRPGVYGFGDQVQTRSLFTPSGGVFGTQERQQQYDIESRTRELEEAERQLRGAYTQ